MITAIYIFSTVIIVTLIFIFFVLRWFINEKLQTYFMSNFFQEPLIVEKAYRGLDFYASFKYTTRDEIIKNSFFRNPHPDEVIVMDEIHKKHIIEKYSRQLVDQMFKSGCIEVKEIDDFEYMPFQKRVDLKVKVYQPEH